MPWRTKEDSVSTVLPATKDRPGDYFIAVIGGKISGADVHLALRLPIPSPFEMRDPALVTQRAAKPQRLRCIRRQSGARIQPWCVRADKKPGLLHSNAACTNVPSTIFSEWNFFSSQSINYSLTLINCPITKLQNTASQIAAPIMSYTARRMGDPVWSITSLYSKTLRDRDCVPTCVRKRQWVQCTMKPLKQS